MKPDDVRKSYEAAWNRLIDLVEQRNKLLRTLGAMAQFAGDFTPDTAMFMEFDFDKAQEILVQVQEMTPPIYAAIEEVNGYREQIGKPKITRPTPPTLDVW
jgi:DnaJ-domain-containing protein 1